MATAFITGASRGIGHGFVRHLSEKGWTVYAGCRSPEKAEGLNDSVGKTKGMTKTVRLDVTDETSIYEACEAVNAEVGHLDLLVNNAGLMIPTRQHRLEEIGERRRQQQGGKFTFEDALEVLRTNSVAPLIIAQAFISLLKRGDKPKIINISSGYASLAYNHGGEPYYYKASKAALNMFVRSFAGDIERQGIITVALDPGWVRTDMGGDSALLTIDESVAGMLRVIEGLTARDNGQFLNWQGSHLPW